MAVVTGVQLLPREEPGGYLSAALVAARHGGGASPVRALARNVGTPRRDGAAGVLTPAAEGRTPSSWNC